MKTLIHRFTALLIAVLYAASAVTPTLAQTNPSFPRLHFKRLTIEEGLSKNAALAILQDSKGLVWFGIQDGLNRYEGYGFYTSRVTAGNDGEVWNETGIAIPTKVFLPSWGTWWLQVIAVLLLVGALAAGYGLRVRNIQGQKKALEAQVAQRTEELRIAQKELTRRAEEELSVSEARFRAMFDSSAAGMGIMSLDRKIIDANPAMCKMLGRTRDELIGQTPALATYPADYQQSTQDFQDLMAGKIDHYWSERRYVRKDGEVFWASVTMSQVRDLHGAPRYLVGMLIDIDEQKRLEEKIRESEARFRAIFDNTTVGIALTTLDRRILAINQAAVRLTGYPMDEMMQINPVDLALPEDRELGAEEFRELLEGKRNDYVMEKRYVRKDGSVFWGRINYSVVTGKDSRPQYLIGMIEDVSEQHEAREKLEAQERAYLTQLEQRVDERTHALAEANQRLTGEVEQRQRAEQALAAKAAEEAVTAERTRLARDLHDAVTQTLFSASLIAEVLPDLWKMDVEEAIKSTEELRQLTRGALAEMRTLLLELRPAALTQARLGDLLKQLSEALIGRARLPINLTVEGERLLPPNVQVALYRIAQESLNNVFKYARATQVDIQLILSPAGVHLEINDTGVGFEPSTLKPTSLGMRIMRERAEAIHADFYVSSSPGNGTQVSVTWNENQAEYDQSINI
jgi:PAS domain S-box-containing protein